MWSQRGRWVQGIGVIISKSWSERYVKYYLGCFTKQNFLCICNNKGIYLSFHTQVAFAGCTACVVYVGADAIHVANAGDCRAVLGVREMDGSWSALELSLDHNSNNQAEVEKNQSSASTVRERHCDRRWQTVGGESFFYFRDCTWSVFKFVTVLKWLTWTKCYKYVCQCVTLSTMTVMWKFNQQFYTFL